MNLPRLIAGLMCAVSTAATALPLEESSPTVLLVPATQNPPVIDGQLEDRCWQDAPWRHAVDLKDGVPMFPASFAVLWDKHALYIAFRAEDQDIRAPHDQSDDRLWEAGDCAEFFIMTPSAESPRIELELSPRNMLLDVLHQTGDFEKDRQWDWPGIEHAVHVDGDVNAAAPDRQWTAELRLPWGALREVDALFIPQVGSELAMLLQAVNRNEIQPGVTVREVTNWPGMAIRRVDRRQDFARLKLMPPAAPGQKVQGFATIVTGKRERHDAMVADYRGLSPYWELDNTKPGDVLQWRSASLPDPLPATIQFIFVGQCMAGSPDATDRATFDLYLGESKVMCFQPFAQKSQTWTQDHTQLTFRHELGRWMPSGVYTLSMQATALPEESLNADRQAMLTLRAQPGQRATLFFLKAWQDAAYLESNREKP